MIKLIQGDLKMRIVIPKQLREYIRLKDNDVILIKELPKELKFDLKKFKKEYELSMAKFKFCNEEK